MSRDIENGGEGEHFRSFRPYPSTKLALTVLILFSAWYVLGVLSDYEVAVYGGLTVLAIWAVVEAAGKGLYAAGKRKWSARQERRTRSAATRLPSPPEPAPTLPAGARAPRPPEPSVPLVRIKFLSADLRDPAHVIRKLLVAQGWRAECMSVKTRGWTPFQGIEVHGPDQEFVEAVVQALRKANYPLVKPMIGPLSKSPTETHEIEVWIGEHGHG